jgi:hypothetical protein
VEADQKWRCFDRLWRDLNMLAAVWLAWEFQVKSTCLTMLFDFFFLNRTFSTLILLLKINNLQVIVRVKEIRRVTKLVLALPCVCKQLWKDLSSL